MAEVPETAPEAPADDGMEEAIFAVLDKHAEAAKAEDGASAPPDEEPTRQAAPVSPSGAAPSSGAADASASRTPSVVSPDGGVPAAPEAVGDASGPKAEPAELVAPAHWPVADKELFAGQTDEVKAFLVERERSITRGAETKFQEAAAMRNAAAPILQALEPLKAKLAADGLTPEQAALQLVGTVQMLQQDPAGALARMMETHGRGIAGTPSAPVLARQTLIALGLSGDVLDSDLAPVADELPPAIVTKFNELATQNQRLQAQITAVMGVERGRAQTIADDAVAGFSDRPHFADLEPRMQQLLNAPGVIASREPQAALEEAYNMAAWENADVRKSLLAQVDKAEVQATERSNGVRKAKISGAAPKGGTNGGVGEGTTALTMDEAINAVFDRHGIPRD